MATWSISVKRKYTLDFFIGYRVDIKIISNISIYNTGFKPETKFILDGSFKGKKEVDLLEKDYTVTYYDDYYIFGISNDTDDLISDEYEKVLLHESYVSKSYTENNKELCKKFRGLATNSFAHSDDHIIRKSQISFSSRNNYDSAYKTELRSYMMVVPKNIEQIDSEEKESEFIKSVIKFLHDNVIMSLVKAVSDYETLNTTEPTIYQKKYTREEILSKIDDPMGYTPQIVISKKEKISGSKNLEYKRKVKLSK